MEAFSLHDARQTAARPRLKFVFKEESEMSTFGLGLELSGTVAD